MAKKEAKLPELTGVERWRFEALVELGLSADDALELRYFSDIVHRAEKLIRDGCPADIAADLLRAD